MTIQLVAVNGYLNFPASISEFGGVILYSYPYPDVETPEVDCIKWPNPNMEHLRGALYDEIMVGTIDESDTILLPDGTEFVW